MHLSSRSFIQLLAPALVGFVGFIGLIGCSSSKAGDSATQDSGAPTVNEGGAGDDGSSNATDGSSAGDAGDAALPDVPEPTYGGVVEPGCQVNGCIHELTAKTSYKQNLLAGNAASNFTVKNGVIEYSIHYVSDGQEIAGSVFFPDSTPPAGGFGVVVMNQFTSGIGAPCTPSGGTLGLGVASATALSGFVTIAPDAQSYGPAPYGAYMVEKIAGRAALDAARAVLHTNIKPLAGRAVIAGLSQGAYSTMSAATEMPGYAPHLAIRGFAAAEPPSNLESGFQAAAKVDNVTIVYDAMRLYSWQGLLKLSGGQIFRSCPGGVPDAGASDGGSDGGGPDGGGCVDYAQSAPGWFANECIYNSDGSSGSLYAEFPMNTSSVLSDTFLGYAQNGNWPADWAAAYAASATVPSGLKPPVLIFEGSADVVVLPANADAYVQQLQAAGVTVDYRKIPNGTHGTTALSSFTVTQLANDQAIAWITQVLAQ